MCGPNTSSGVATMGHVHVSEHTMCRFYHHSSSFRIGYWLGPSAFKYDHSGSAWRYLTAA